MREIYEKSGKWTFLAPVDNLELTDLVRHEIRIDRVTFVSADRLPLVRRRLGLPRRVSELRKRETLDRYFFEPAKAFAVMRHSGTLKDIEAFFLKTLREELAILGASWLNLPRERHSALPSFSGERPRGTRSYLCLHGSGAAWTQPNQTIGAFSRTTDAFWLRAAREQFFFNLLKWLRGEVQIAKLWRTDLRNAAVMIGESQASKDPWVAFLYNMIALELLLTRQGDAVKDALPERAEAFLGWVGYWSAKGFPDRIQELYSKRCRLVHQGAREGIEPLDVIFTDELLLNVLSNLVRNPKLFASKDAVVDFSERVRAEHLLGIDANVRPKTFRAWWRTNVEKSADNAF